MNFIETFHRNIEENPGKSIVTEMHGDRPMPADGRAFAKLVASARGTLRAEGVEPGDRVALVAPNSAKWAATDVAALDEGAIVVPMYARQDRGELVWMMKDCGAKVVIVPDETMAGEIHEHWADAPIVTYDKLFSGEEVREDPKPREDDDVVSIIYTSGTSGNPKGVMLTVANVDYMLPIVRDALIRLMGERDTDDRVFHYLPFCFAGSRIVLWVCLYRANPITVSTNLDNLKEEFVAAQPHYFLNVPTLLERIKNGVEDKVQKQGGIGLKLYEAGRDAWQRQLAGEARPLDALVSAVASRVVFKKIRDGIGSNLECLICGSAPLGEDTQRWFEMLGIPVYQVYGLTETTGIVTMDEPRQAVPGRVGHAIEGCETKLGDDDELLVRGPNLFKGYWNLEQATRDAFDGDGWYHTGDRAEVDSNGNWRIIGRVKNVLVPSSGHNVNPEPIEQMIVERTPGVAHAVVMGHGRPFLTAVVSGEVDRQVVQKHLDEINAELPHYRRIRAFHLTREELTPENGLLTANQKLKRPALEGHFRDAVEALYASAEPAPAKGARPRP